MNKVVRIKNDNYTHISNFCAREKDLSLKAKGIYYIVMSLPDDWDFSIRGLCAITKEGKHSVYSAIDELKKHGYCSVNVERDNNHRIIGNNYTFYGEPSATQQHDSQPCSNNQDAENQDTGNRTQINEENNKDIEENSKEKEILKEKTDDDVFVDNIYAMYPAKCPIRNTSLGKCSKDKDRIRKLLKTYSKEDIEKVVTHEVDEKLGKSMMQNFSTFLNNFPDPNSLFGDNVGGTLAYPKSVEDVNEDDIQPTYPFFVDWLEKNCRNLLDNIRGGYPNNNGQYKRLAECTKGGTKGVAYVCLVLNRDGWDKYYDKRGFMWIYSNYIKANGLFIG